MRSIIGLVLFIVWGLLLVLGLAEPTPTTEIPDNPEWVGWVYIMLLLGLPFIFLNIAHDDVKRG
jgi:TRAP-type C4-dicarboxylate transport system permease small subunit